EIRKYKLCEVFKKIESKTLEKLVNEWRKFYKMMKNYKRNPTPDGKIKVEKEFDRIVAIRTLVKPLDKQLDLTKKLRPNLLLFLKYSFIPLDNNQIERDLREKVIKRKISLQNRSRKGVKAWDLMLSLASTCRKLNLSFWDYLEDRISKWEAIPYLGKLVTSL
ncbi:MAG: transposase, partial [Bacteriovoracaceae bacterium]